MTKLFVGSLPFVTTEQELNDMFKQFGQVATAKLMMDRETGRSRGFAFVEMPNDAEAQAAIEKLNNSNVGGRQIVVNVARPMEKREGGRGFGGGGGGGRGFGGGGRDGGGGRGGNGGGKREGFKRW